MARVHNSSCSGCPYCSTAMAAILSDSVAGNHEALADKLNAMSVRDSRRAGVTIASGTPGPPPSLGDAINARRDAPSTRQDRVKDGLASGRSEPTQPPKDRKVEYVDDPR